MRARLVFAIGVAAACHRAPSQSSPDARVATVDAATSPIDGHAVASDAGVPMPQCAPFGAPGTCITTTACAALGDHSSYPGYCPGPANIECCIDTPDVADDPPPPAGWKLMAQSSVTSDMTTWAVTILHDTTMYPMFSTTIRQFPTLLVLARVEWHPPDFQNGIVHRGVTLYQPA
jgi:hypothetical protein